jgi:hypothetical protein
MAGSFEHVTKDNGALISNEKMNGMLENGGDVFEAVEHMYGMIWWLAEQKANEQFGKAADPALYVEAAAERPNAAHGRAISPTKRYKE